MAVLRSMFEYLIHSDVQQNAPSRGKTRSTSQSHINPDLDFDTPFPSQSYNYISQPTGHLQLAIACLGRLLAVLVLVLHLGLALVVERLQPLGQNWVGVVVCRVEVVGIHAGQILDLELDESSGKFCLVAEIESEFI